MKTNNKFSLVCFKIKTCQLFYTFFNNLKKSQKKRTNFIKLQPKHRKYSPYITVFCTQIF